MTTSLAVLDTDSVRFPDDSLIELRPLGILDGRLISNFLGHLSPESEYKRFLSAAGGVRNQWVANLVNADQRDFLVHGAVAINEFGSSLVAIAESISDPGDRQRAEFALAAVDPWQNMGIGTLLTRHVARIARSHGVRYWDTNMLAENNAMARVMSRVGTMLSHRIDHGLAKAVHELYDF